MTDVAQVHPLIEPQEDRAMDHSFSDSPSWYRAITLAERIQSLRAVRGRMPKPAVDVDRGEQRLQRWRSQPPFTAGSYFPQRLAVEGIGAEELLYLLGEPVEGVSNRFSTPPRWLAELAKAFSGAPPAERILSQGLPGRQMLGLLNIIEPLVSQGRDRLHQLVEELIQLQTDLPFDPATVEHLLFANLPLRLLEMASRTLVLELNVARLQGFLEGDTPEARFLSFLERLGRRDIALALLQEYPVLARGLTMYIDRWVAVNLEFLLHLCGDWAAIRSTFSSERDPGVLVQLARASNEGGGGRSVQVAQFSSGLRIVYKPRSLGLDVHFQELLAWINNRGDHPPFAALKLLDRGPYGWVEFVTAQGCSSLEEIRRFYRRQGGYLALLHALEAIDLHFGNVIAKGEQPMLIDLETLFQPRLGRDCPEQVDRLAGDPSRPSVLRVGLLPERLWATPEFEGVDISGLSAVAGQMTPFLVPHWEQSGTDEMCIVHRRAVIPGGQNLPSLNGAEVNAFENAEAIVFGFTEIYQLLLKCRRDLLAKNGPVARFAEDEVGVFLRSKNVYEMLLRDGYHPDMLRDALDRDRLFDGLWAAVESAPYLTKVIAAEREDLWKGDIPIFTTRPGSRDLWTSSNQRIPNFFDEPSMNLVKRRIQQLSEDDLSHQLSIIGASFTTAAGGPAGA
jgi:type 2 lantibiotic biosynthesis protein LanM